MPTTVPTPGPHGATLRSVALVGNPNCGKTALFNLLTGARQKVANYAGVTVERKRGQARLPDGRSVVVIDLPGTYSLQPATPDEQVTLEVIAGQRAGEDMPDALLVVVDATNLQQNLRLVLECRALGRPMLVVLNMADMARRCGLQIDTPRLAAELGCPVVETVAVQADGHAALLQQLAHWVPQAPLVPVVPQAPLVPVVPQAPLVSVVPQAPLVSVVPQAPSVSVVPVVPVAPVAASGPPGAAAGTDPAALQREVRRLLAVAVTGTGSPAAAAAQRLQLRLDAWVLHPLWGPVILAALLFVVFQAVFSWANAPMDWIKAGMAAAGEAVTGAMAPGPLRSLLVDGAIAGAGSVLVFLPQILILFFFILALEDSGYLPRAAFLLDTLMGKVGLSGRAFIPLLSSFACAVPGVMATRTIAHWRDRITTIMVAPLMTCSARLPVYALLIGAFIPDRAVGPFNLRGLVLFALYLAGVASACGVAWLFKRLYLKNSYQPLMLELPPYRWPAPRTLAIGLWERARIFLRRVGTIIFSLMVVLWFLSTWPAPPPGATGPDIGHSLAGMLGRGLQPLFAPIGFNWQICIALVPGLAAREVAVGALGTVYALSAAGDGVAEQLGPLIAQGWSLATALSLLAWYVFAPQCISTLAAVRRETNSWRYPLAMALYQFALAYAAAFATYRVALLLGG